MVVFIESAKIFHNQEYYRIFLVKTKMIFKFPITTTTT